jgi:hypothetical protein
LQQELIPSVRTDINKTGKIIYSLNDVLLGYHKSWDWLMPVVEKIESLDLKEWGYKWESHDGEIEYNNGSICVEIERNRCWIYMNLQLDPFHTFNEQTRGIDFPTKLEATYQAVVEFIKWYNVQKETNSQNS